jgi:hypothetical protein
MTHFSSLTLTLRSFEQGKQTLVESRILALGFSLTAAKTNVSRQPLVATLQKVLC